MADDPNSTPVPPCTRATTAIDAIARAKALGEAVVITLLEARDANMGFVVGAVIEGIVRELADAEAALSRCPRS